MSDLIDGMLRLVAQRNPNFYEFVNGNLMKAS